MEHKDHTGPIELILDEEEGLDGVFAISLVEDPAIESDFVALSKQKVRLKVSDKEKRLVTGLALIPNKEILRVDPNGEPYHIFFSEDTVRTCSQIYLREMRNRNTTFEHEMLVDGVYLSESWIVEDPKMDKLNLYGIDSVKGAWAISMKVENDQVWQRVKNGEVLGFSIEGLFDKNRPDEFKKQVEDIIDLING